MRIGQLSKLSGFSRDTIRFYEKKGLIRVVDAGRDRYQFKDYPDTVLKRLHAIRQIKEYGFTLQETLAMLILFEEGVLEPERGIRYVRRKMDRIDQQINQLLTVKSRLQEVIDKTHTGNCPIDKALNEAFPKAPIKTSA
jgi:DNA-binding transcriptional MerR regulator